MSRFDLIQRNKLTNITKPNQKGKKIKQEKTKQIQQKKKQIEATQFSIIVISFYFIQRGSNNFCNIVLSLIL
jgi:hypothetical protein